MGVQGPNEDEDCGLNSQLELISAFALTNWTS